MTSSNVAIKAFTRVWGRLLTNPTVSISMNSCFVSNFTLRCEVSSVAKSIFFSDTVFSSFIPSMRKRFMRADLPEFVYPTRATIGMPDLSLWDRLILRFFLASSSSFCISFILRLICRRSVSSFFSPGPLVPMPPPSLDNAFPKPVRRGRRY